MPTDVVLSADPQHISCTTAGTFDPNSCSMMCVVRLYSFRPTPQGRLPCSHKSTSNLQQVPKTTKVILPPIPNTPIIPTTPRSTNILKHSRQPNPKLPQQSMQRAPSTDQWHNNSHESFERMSARIVPKVAYQAFQLAEQGLDVIVSGAAFVVRGGGVAGAGEERGCG